MPEVAVRTPRWLLLVHQLPSRPSNLRVHTWRRLQQIGAVALRNALYVLPNTAEAREDFAWIRTEIAARGGQVSVLSAQAVDGYTDDELEASFRRARNADYDALIADAGALAAPLTRRQHRLPRAGTRRLVGRMRDRLQALKGADFFGASRAAEAETAVARLERLVQASPGPAPSTERLDARRFRRRVWVTRPHPGIDRMASAWLIRRFIAADAAFAFAAAPRRGQIAFDMADVEFGHHGSECTYETLVRRFGITDPAAIRVGHLVHDLDLKESRYGIPDAPTVGRLVEGLRQAGPSDRERLENGMTMIEALYRSFLTETARPSAGRKRRAGGGQRRHPRS